MLAACRWTYATAWSENTKAVEWKTEPPLAVGSRIVPCGSRADLRRLGEVLGRADGP
jgi:hypothetical protein